MHNIVEAGLCITADLICIVLHAIIVSYFILHVLGQHYRGNEQCT